MFSKVLVANRGEIAVRIIRALDELGVASVAVYSELDRDAPHVKRAGESYNLGDGPAAENYLNVEKILDAAKRAGAEAIHPGYGFLAENAPFAQACEDAGIVFIGPPASAIEAMGSKTRARELMQAAGVPIVPGTTQPVATVADALRIANDEIGFPVAVKAAGGGGGKGFRVALTEDELEGAFEGSSREGEKFFSDPTVYLERYLHDPRHVEVQVLADRHGNVIHLGERDCSIQRRHQKVIEESPAPEWVVTPEIRERIGKIGVDAAKAVDYVGAGTIEGLFSAADGKEPEYFFLEMNTRVQVEHCVTEMTTGIDIVKEGIKAAAGEELAYAQDDIELRGHAIECRINAEDASKNFAPAPGKIGVYREPSGPGRARRLRRAGRRRSLADVRPDGRQADRLGRRPRAGHQAHAARALRIRDRRAQDADPLPSGAARHRAVGARRDLPRPARGQAVAEDARLPRRRARRAATARRRPRRSSRPTPSRSPASASTCASSGPRSPAVASSAARHMNGSAAGDARARRPKRGERKSSSGGGPDTLPSPLQGNMWKVLVKQGDEVEEGQLLCIIEAMKMENEITAHKAGKIVELPITEGAPIQAGAPIATIVSAPAAA